MAMDGSTAARETNVSGRCATVPRWTAGEPAAHADRSAATTGHGADREWFMGRSLDCAAPRRLYAELLGDAAAGLDISAPVCLDDGGITLCKRHRGACRFQWVPCPTQ